MKQANTTTNMGPVTVLMYYTTPRIAKSMPDCTNRGAQSLYDK